MPDPGRLSLTSGTGVTIMSCIDVTVPVDLLKSLEASWRLDDKSGRSNIDFRADEISIPWRDSSCEVDWVVEDDSVGAAGAVELVTIWRLTCRGK